MTAVAHMRRWRASLVAFVREVLRAVPDAWQVEVLEAIASGRWSRYALKASKGPGKSTLLAWVIWWFLATRLHPKVVATSITEDNLSDGLWTELAKWQANSEFLKATFTWRKTRITCNDSPETWWASARTWPKGGDSSQQANTLAGVHADNVLFVLDEAGGIPDAVMAAAEGGLANADKAAGREAKLLIAGNPTHNEGPLFRACTTEAALWWVKEISGDPDDPQRAPRVSIEWAREQIAKYGRDHDFVRVNVFGKFPRQSSDTLLGPDDVAEAMKRVLPRTVWEKEVKILGVDVARHGDDRTVITLRQGPVCFAPRILRINDTMQVAGQVSLLFDKHKPDGLFVDMATFGAGVVDRLAQLGYPVVGVDSSANDYDGTYRNKRAAMWFRMAAWVKGGGVLPSLPELTAELTTPRYKFDEANHLQLEKKADVKKRTGCSPDIADSLAFTFALPVAHREVREQLEARSHVGRRADYDPFAEA